MKDVEFNLLDEPWIRVLCPDCSVKEVSLTQALLRAQEYTDLAGELPTQDVAVLRLLLAVLHAVFERVDAEGQPIRIESLGNAVRQWESLWLLGRFPEQPVLDYLKKWHDRFWLFHPDRPFWQVSQAEIGTEYTAAKLTGELSESGNKRRLFPTYAGKEKTEMTFGQAARWLIYVNGFDDTSAKPRQKGLPSTGAGWLGKLGLIQAVGHNLFETLMLNLTLMQDGSRIWGEERPCWELDIPHSKERTGISLPDNQSELLTLQSRRLLLQRNDDKVTGYTLLGGDFFDRTNAFCEQMTVWRSNQEKKNQPITYTPKRHDMSRQFWREFPTVFDETSAGNTPVHTPGIVRWVTVLQNPANHCLDRRILIHFRVAAVEYGDKDFFVTDTFSDGISFHLSLLDEMGRSWRKKITLEISRCEQLANAIGHLVNDLAVAAGSHAKKLPQTAKEQFYFEIDQPFRQWLSSIDPEWEEEETDASLAAWQGTAMKIARRLGTQLVEQAGPTAFAGRAVKPQSDKGKSSSQDPIYYAAPKAYNSFLYQIQKIYDKKGGA